SAIVCVARDLLASEGAEPLHTFSAICDDVPASDERAYMHAVVAQGNVRPHYLHLDRLGPLTAFEGAAGEAEPLWGPQLALHWPVYQAAERQRVGVLLDGFDGDRVTSNGMAYLTELARAGRWPAFLAEATAVGRHSGMPLRSVALAYGVAPLTP